MVQHGSRSRSSIVAHNLRRLMARDGLTYDAVVQKTGLDSRTLRGILHAVKRPHAKTLMRLAEGLGVSTDELFAADEAAALAEFDLASNPSIDQVVQDKPELFDDWSPSDFGELASRFGVGGELTPEGVVAMANQMNANRESLDRAAVVLETAEAETLRGVINALFHKTIEAE